MFRRREGRVEVLLVHPGGPFWASKDLGAWTLPKGEIEEGEAPLAAAIREFAEETGFAAAGDFQSLDAVTQASGKVVYAWMVEGDCDPSQIKSLTFSVEWPPRSGRVQEFPEIDRAAWFPLEEARMRILAAQEPLIDRLERRLEEQ